ncbi:zinc finger and BTB domain-containing protein 22b [Syngnathoides biaculeatus]|uniref:zinc finger and BTB domain-containing protein 22b n=1 Tax=Syngnathoides biaculeatus TaxID=300417 RepID=UPI002ADD6B7F|nr:zinc finger and BTB domain-containing protein 22b [Syngnathoides biaculeatus]
MQSSWPQAGGDSVVQLRFPSAQASVLDGLNRQREDGRLCDLAIHVQGRVFKAHRCVLAASSPYFHDQVLLKNMSRVSIPAVMDPLAFEGVLRCAYTGQLRMPRQDVVNYLTVGSVLQMWHIVDKCTELLKEGGGGGGGLARDQARPAGSREQSSDARAPQGASRAPAAESQSPSSTDYFCPGGAAPAGGEGFAIEAGAREEEDDDDDDRDREQEQGQARQRKKARGRRKKSGSSASEEDVGVGDGFGVSSYQDGEGASHRGRPGERRGAAVEAERAEARPPVAVSGEAKEGEGEAQEEDRDEPDGGEFTISHVRTLSAEVADAQMDFCQSSQDFLKWDAAYAQRDQDAAAGPIPSRGAAPPGPVPSRGDFFPLDMQGNQILVYGQTSAFSADALPTAPPPLSGIIGGEHGPALPGGGGGASGKVFMCHCGKTFTHKSMRERHVNMHLDLRPFHCPVCGKKFKMKHHLTEHTKTHTGLKPYRCSGCGRKFMWRDSFVRHRSHCERRGGGGPRFLLPPGAEAEPPGPPRARRPAVGTRRPLPSD